jgi:hypothetical protein
LNLTNARRANSTSCDTYRSKLSFDQKTAPRNQNHFGGVCRPFIFAFMVRTFCAYALVVLLFGNGLGDAVRLLWYQVHRDSFAARYCVNLERPQLQCHGRCQLPQLIDTQQERQEQGQETPPLTLRLPSPFIAYSLVFVSLNLKRPVAIPLPAYRFSYRFLYHWAPFHPPL